MPAVLNTECNSVFKVAILQDQDETRHYCNNVVKIFFSENGVKLNSDFVTFDFFDPV